MCEDRLNLAKSWKMNEYMALKNIGKKQIPCLYKTKLQLL